MSTSLRPEVSKSNPYWIERHRYYELKHFCMQYPFWKYLHDSLASKISTPSLNKPIGEATTLSDPVTFSLDELSRLSDKIKMLERIAKETDPVLGKFVLRGVTEGISYDILRMKTCVPCCKDVYYDLYRRFFWLLDKERQ
jgi:hypothetical protein